MIILYDHPLPSYSRMVAAGLRDDNIHFSWLE